MRWFDPSRPYHSSGESVSHHATAVRTEGPKDGYNRSATQISVVLGLDSIHSEVAQLGEQRLHTA